MAPPEEHAPPSIDIVAHVGYSDALLATFSQFFRRGRPVMRAYAAVLAASAGAAWLTDGELLWLPALVVAGGGAALTSTAWVARRDFRRAGGKPLRVRYHVCGSGVEIRSAGRGDWVAWEDVWDAGETRRSFLLSPSPGEHYVIPKRCCDARAVEGLRQMLRAAGVQTARC